MANTLITKNSSTAAAIPTAGQLVQGELAVNVTDKRVFTENAAGAVVELGVNPSSLTLASGTANGVAYLNASKVLTSGSALTFDGTTLLNTAAAPSSTTELLKLSRDNSGTFIKLTRNAASGNSGGLIGSDSVGTYYAGASTANMLYVDGVNDNLQFYANSAEQMRLTSTGLGIGTSSPRGKLDVVLSANSGFYTRDNGDGVILTNPSNTIGLSTASAGSYSPAAGSVWYKQTNGASGSHNFGINGASALYIDSAGNLGLGVTPSGWGSNYKAIQLAGGSLASFSNSALDLYSNAYDSDAGAWKYVASLNATRYAQSDGKHIWFTAPSGTAGAAISFTQAMTLDASGNLGIGTSAPTYKLTVQSGSTTILAGADSSANTLTDATQKVMRFGVPHYTNAEEPVGALFGSNTATENNVFIGGGSGFFNAATLVSFYTAANTTTQTGSERMRITSAGNVGIGTTSPTVKLDVVGTGVVSSFLSTNNNYVVQVRGNNATYGAWLGTTNSDDFFIANAAAGTEKFRITSAGNVGIGTSSPLSLMHLSSASPRITITDTDTGADHRINADSGAGNLAFDIDYNSETAAPSVIFNIKGSEKLRITSAGNVGIGTTSPDTLLNIQGVNPTLLIQDSDEAGDGFIKFQTANGTQRGYIQTAMTANVMLFGTGTSERMRLDSSGNLLVGKTASNNTTLEGLSAEKVGGDFTLRVVNTNASSSEGVLLLNLQNDEGGLVTFRQNNTTEGSISVSGTTVSYNGGHLSRWAQTTVPKDNTLVKGTVLSNLDAMNVYTDADGNLVDNEQLNKVKVSDVEGDANVAGVFVNWEHDDAHDVDEINMAMTGDMIIRIAQGVTVVRGDLLMSAGNGTAKPQGDDIVRSKTIAKVTSTHVTCTYEDGSYCVPCVLMAC